MSNEKTRRTETLEITHEPSTGRKIVRGLGIFFFISGVIGTIIWTVTLGNGVMTNSIMPAEIYGLQLLFAGSIIVIFISVIMIYVGRTRVENVTRVITTNEEQQQQQKPITSNDLNN